MFVSRPGVPLWINQTALIQVGLPNFYSNLVISNPPGG